MSAARLDARLGAVAEAVPPGAVVVDVGAGDGVLSAWLAARGHRVIATELGRSALETRRRLGAAGVDLRAGDGLAPVAPGEVDVAVVSGMGGRRMIGIIERSRAVVASLELMVLQPVQHAAVLRDFVATRHHLLREASVEHRGRVYEVFVVKPHAT